MKSRYFDSWLTTRDPNRRCCSFFMLKNTSVSKRGDVKVMALFVNPVFFPFEMRRHTKFAEMNVTLTTIKEAQLPPFDSWNMRYLSSKFWNCYLLKKFTLIKALFFLINIFRLSFVFLFFFDFLIPVIIETTHNSCS